MYLATIDFETEAINTRPIYPPIPVGVAIRTVKGSSRYLAWGHPSENNTTKREAIRFLKSIWKQPLLFHNAAFDMEVAVEHLGLPPPLMWEDTLILAYLYDPRAESLSLKPMAEKYLDMPPDEQTELREWIITNIPEAKKAKSKWGAHISKAPGKLVGRYAVGDVVRTYKLYRYLHKEVIAGGMATAYQREKRMIGIKLDMERAGIRIAPKLKTDIQKWRSVADKVDNTIRKKLKLSPDAKLQGPQLADALIVNNKLDKIVKTPTGKISTKRSVLEENCNDSTLIQLLGFNGILRNYIGTFLEPWLLSYENNEGKIYPSFNTIRSTDEYGRGGVGTRTGRLSSSNPNFQNIPANVEGSQHEQILLALQKYLEECGLRFVGLRDYIIPRAGRIFIARDYSQQELRILAHYEDGELIQQYLKNPTLDIHEFIRQLIHTQMHVLYPRKFIKIVVFAILYGRGNKNLALQLGSSLEDAKQLKTGFYNAVPGVRWLDEALKDCAAKKQPIYTWGGRRYYAEEDTWIKDPYSGEWVRKRWWYKLLNLLIQGSAADATKQGMVNVADAINPEYTSMLVQVHDELLLEVDKGAIKSQGKVIKDAMENLNFDVPMLTEAKIGSKSWAKLSTTGR